MGKNKNHFAFLSTIDPDEQEEVSEDEGTEDEENRDEGTEDEEESELERKIVAYHVFVREQRSLLQKDIQNNINLTKNIIRIFLSTLDQCYDMINEMRDLMRHEGIEEKERKIFELDEKLNPIYVLMDKYRDSICSEEGMRRLNRLDFLNEVDIYYNLFICTGCPRYILCGLEYSSMEMLNVVDFIFFKEKRKNEMKRYKTYLLILCQKKRKDPNLLTDKDMKTLSRICSRDEEIKKEFRRLFD